MLKKILTIISILLVAVNVFAYAEQTDADYERLLHLGIVDDTYELYEKKKTVSEKEFLSALVRILTDDKIEEDRVPEYAKSRGIISTINAIELKSAISYERALNLSLNVLGYSKIIEMNENSKEAIVKLAGSSGLNSGITLLPDDNLNGKSFVKLLTNLIEANVITVGLGKNGSTGYKTSNKDVLSEYRDITKITGLVTRVCDTSLLSEDGCGDNKVAIDEVIYKIGYDYSPEILGQTVYAYVKDVNNVSTVYYIETQISGVKRTEIKDKDIVSVASDFSKITYEEDERTRHITLNPALTVIYNGQNYTAYTVSDLQPKCGSIVCLDFDNDNKYDIVYVYSYETMVVKNVSQAYETIANLYSVPAGINILDLSDSSLDIRIYSEGKEASFSSILANNILSVAQSKGANKIVRIYVSKETVSGEFSTVDPTEKTVTIGKDEYRVNDAYYDALVAGDPIDSMSLGSVYTCYLDAFGNIAFVKRGERDGYEYAFLLKQKWDRIEDTAKVRLLNSEGDWEDVYYAKKVKLNSQNRQDAETVYNSLGKDTIDPQLIMIKRDADGRIKAIKTSTVSSTYNPDLFTAVSATDISRTYRSQDESFHCRHYLKYDAAVFLKPAKAADKYNEKLYAVMTAGYFRGDRKYTYQAYNVDEFGFPDAFVVSVNSAPGKEVTIYVNKTMTILNSDNEVVRAVVGNVEGLENMNIQVSPDFTSPISAGDVIEVKLVDAIIDAWNTSATEQQYSVASTAPTSRVYTLPSDDAGTTHANGVMFKGDIKAVNIDRRILLLDCGTETIPVYVRGDADINIYNNDTKKYELRTINEVTPGGYAIIKMDGNNVTSVGVFK